MAFENTMHPVPAVAADVMHRVVVAVGPDTRLDQAIKLMNRNRIMDPAANKAA
jgi:CBS domain-containing protein